MSNENDMLTEIAIALFLSVTCLVAGEPISGEPATTHDSPITNRRSPITDHQKSNSALAYMNGARVATVWAKSPGRSGRAGTPGREWPGSLPVGHRGKYGGPQNYGAEVVEA